MSTNSTALGDLPLGQTRGRIFALLFGRPDQSFYIRQIAGAPGLVFETGDYFRAQHEASVICDLGDMPPRSPNHPGRQTSQKGTGFSPYRKPSTGPGL
jgi:hypothetical protein